MGSIALVKRLREAVAEILLHFLYILMDDQICEAVKGQKKLKIEIYDDKYCKMILNLLLDYVLSQQKI